MEHVVGMMWNKDEGDILKEIITAAIEKVDSLFIADDGSTDNSWKIIQDCQKMFPDRIEHIQRKPNVNDRSQRNSLLYEIRRRYKPENTWVQIIESDIMILETDVREAIREFASQDIAVTWQCLNAVRRGKDSWKGWDRYPDWDDSITKVMPCAHWMEVMTYTFRPLPELRYSGPWRPWPRGWTKYITEGQPVKINRKFENSPLLAHYGHRGPSHFYNKYKGMGKRHTRYKAWDLRSVKSVNDTVFFFNGQWNGRAFTMNRAHWIEFVRSRKED